MTETARLSPLFTWRGAIVDSDLPATSRLVALVLSLHMNERGGSCFPSQKTIAREAGLTVETVRDHLSLLSKSGWLRKEQRHNPGRSGSQNWYTATTPPVENPVDDEAETSGVETPSGVEDPTGSGVETPTQEDVSRGRQFSPLPPRGRRRADSNPLTNDERGPDFQTFWDAYPKKTHRFPAEQAWVKMLDDLPPIDRLLTAVETMNADLIAHHTGTAPGGWQRFAVRPDAWLSDRRWRDYEHRQLEVVTVPKCHLCGVRNPGLEGSACMGVEVGLLGDETDCPHRSEP